MTNHLTAACCAGLAVHPLFRRSPVACTGFLAMRASPRVLPAALVVGVAAVLDVAGAVVAADTNAAILEAAAEIGPEVAAVAGEVITKAAGSH
jgi:hypothetical protein